MIATRVVVWSAMLLPVSCVTSKVTCEPEDLDMLQRSCIEAGGSFVGETSAGQEFACGVGVTSADCDIDSEGECRAACDMSSIHRDTGVGNGGGQYRSCKELLDSEPLSESGSYILYPFGDDRSAHARCDMDTDGGGWTLVLGLETDEGDRLGGYTAGDSAVQGLEGARDGRGFVSVAHLAELSNYWSFTQVRFFCRKPAVGRSLHLMSTSDGDGAEVVDYFTLRMGDEESCRSSGSCSTPSTEGSVLLVEGSHGGLADEYPDSSYLSGLVEVWSSDGEGHWGGRTASPGDRLQTLPIFAEEPYSNENLYWYITPGRLNCDDAEIREEQVEVVDGRENLFFANPQGVWRVWVR